VLAEASRRRAFKFRESPNLFLLSCARRQTGCCVIAIHHHATSTSAPRNP